MLKSIIRILRDIFRDRSIHESLEAYIIAGNPQGPVDVEQLEREYWEKRRHIDFFNGYI